MEAIRVVTMFEVVEYPIRAAQVIGLTKFTREAGESQRVVFVSARRYEALREFMIALAAALELDERIGVVRADPRLNVPGKLRINLSRRRFRRERTGSVILAYTSGAELGSMIDVGWNRDLRTFQIFPAGLRSNDLDKVRSMDEEEALAKLLTASCAISCGENGDHLAHVVPLTLPTEEVRRLVDWITASCCGAA